MPEQRNPIIRKEVVVVESMDYDKYGNLLFKDKGGNDHKIGVKRIELAKQIVEGRAVELGYSEYMNKEYIAEAKLVEGGLPPPVTPIPRLPQQPITSSIPPKEVKQELKPETISGVTVGMTINNITQLICAKMLKEVFQETVPKVNGWYKSQMLHNMGIVVDSPLVKIAKQQGAEEIEKEV